MKGPSCRGEALKAAALSLIVATMCLAAHASPAYAAPLLTFPTLAAGPLEADLAPASGAGIHSFELESEFSVGTVFNEEVGYDVPAATLKDLAFELPPGLVGDPGVVPKCRQSDM